MFGSAGGAFLAVVDYAGLFEAQPGAQAGDEAVAFGEAVELVDDAAVHQAEDSGIGDFGQFGHEAHEGVEELEADAACAAVSAAAALTKDDLKSFLPFFDHGGDDFGRVLKIAVDQDHAVAGGVVDAGSDGGLMAEIAGEADELDAGVLGVIFANNLGGAVAAAVIDQDDFPVVAGGVEGGADAAAELGEVVFFVEDGGYDGNHGASPGRVAGVGWACFSNSFRVTTSKVPYRSKGVVIC